MAPMRLAVQRQRIDDAADILDGDVVEHFDMTGLRIDRDVSGMRAVAVGALAAREGAFSRNPSAASAASATDPSTGPDAPAAVDLDLVGGAAQTFRCRGADRAAQLRRRRRSSRNRP